MDDTPARMKPEGQGRTDPRSTEDVTGRTQESMRGYAGDAVAPPATSGPMAPPVPAPRGGSPGHSDEEEPDTRHIRAGIERTREDMAETIDAIQERLRPGNLAAEAGERVRRSATSRIRSLAGRAGEGAQSMMEHTRGTAGRLSERAGQNPIPAALIGVGAAWLLWNQNRSSRRRQWEPDRDWSGRYPEAAGYEGFDVRADLDDPYLEYEYGETGEWEGGYGWRQEEGWGSRLMHRVADHPVPAALTCAGLAWLAFSDSDGRTGRMYSTSLGREPYRTGTETAGTQEEPSATQRARESLSGVASRASEATRDVAERAGRYARRARQRMPAARRGTRNQVQRLMHRNPLLAGAGAFVLGAVVGLLLPETERENEWMGDTRDRVLDRAQEKAREAAQSVASGAKEMAGEAVGKLAAEVAGGSSREQSSSSRHA